VHAELTDHIQTNCNLTAWHYYIRYAKRGQTRGVSSTSVLHVKAAVTSFSGLMSLHVTVVTVKTVTPTAAVVTATATAVTAAATATTTVAAATTAVATTTAAIAAAAAGAATTIAVVAVVADAVAAAIEAVVAAVMAVAVPEEGEIEVQGESGGVRTTCY
jgi:hypothetical protein